MEPKYIQLKSLLTSTILEFCQKNALYIDEIKVQGTVVVTSDCSSILVTQIAEKFNRNDHRKEILKELPLGRDEQSEPFLRHQRSPEMSRGEGLMRSFSFSRQHSHSPQQEALPEDFSRSRDKSAPSLQSTRFESFEKYQRPIDRPRGFESPFPAAMIQFHQSPLLTPSNSCISPSSTSPYSESGAHGFPSPRGNTTPSSAEPSSKQPPSKMSPSSGPKVARPTHLQLPHMSAFSHKSSLDTPSLTRVTPGQPLGPMPSILLNTPPYAVSLVGGSSSPASESLLSPRHQVNNSEGPVISPAMAGSRKHIFLRNTSLEDSKVKEEPAEKRDRTVMNSDPSEQVVCTASPSSRSDAVEGATPDKGISPSSDKFPGPSPRSTDHCSDPVPTTALNSANHSKTSNHGCMSGRNYIHVDSLTVTSASLSPPPGSTQSSLPSPRMGSVYAASPNPSCSPSSSTSVQCPSSTSPAEPRRNSIEIYRNSISTSVSNCSPSPIPEGPTPERDIQPSPEQNQQSQAYVIVPTSSAVEYQQNHQQPEAPPVGDMPQSEEMVADEEVDDMEFEEGEGDEASESNLKELLIKKNAKPTYGKHHNLTKTVGGRYKCPLCNNSYSFQASLKRHMEKHYGKNYTCEHCGIVFESLQGWSHHSKLKHRQHMPLECSICKMKFNTKSALGQHYKKRHL